MESSKLLHYMKHEFEVMCAVLSNFLPKHNTAQLAHQQRLIPSRKSASLVVLMMNTFGGETFRSVNGKELKSRTNQKTSWAASKEAGSRILCLFNKIETPGD